MKHLRYLILVVAPTIGFAQSPSLREAVDDPDHTWVATGSQPWIGQSSIAHDGVDAARSGSITHSQRSVLHTTVIGPGTVGFWWKVSSASGDLLEFDRTGEWQAEISGETGWEQRAFAIFSGENVLEWVYSKDASGSEGADAAWVDQVVVITNSTTPPTVVRQPISRFVAADNTVSFQVEVLGSIPLRYQWRLNGTNLPGANSRFLSLPGVQTEHAGQYSVVVTNTAGWTVSSNATLAVLSSLAGAVDTAGFTWKTDGAGWIARTDLAHDGVDASRSGPITNSGQASIWTTVTGPGTVAFWWRVSSRTNADPLFFKDGLAFWTQGTSEWISGEIGWEQRAFSIASGSQTLKWTYSRSADPSQGLDTGWLDQVVIVTNTTTAPALVRQPQPASIVSGTVGTMTVEVLGSTPLTYQWRLNGTPLAGQTNRSLTVSNVSSTTAGPYSVTVTNASGWVVSSNVSFVILPNLAEALDATNITWFSFSTRGPAYAWFVQTSTSLDGEDAVQSRPLLNYGDTARLQTTFTGPARLSFWWRNTGSFHLLLLMEGADVLASCPESRTPDIATAISAVFRAYLTF